MSGFTLCFTVPMIKCIRDFAEQKCASFNQRFQLDLSLLLALFVVAQHSFPIKFFGIGILIFLHFQDLTRSNLSKVPWFYWALPLLELLKFFLLRPDFSKAHFAQFSVGMIYWFAALIVCMVLYVRTAQARSKQVERSLACFTLVNLAVSIAQFVRICLHERCLNPFNTGAAHPYGVSSGDMITGILGGVHLTNTFICLILLIYFISKQRYWLVAASLLPFLLAGSNFATLALVVCLGILVWVQRNRMQVWIASFSVMLTVVAFYVFVTPVNARYMLTKFETILGRKVVADEQYQLGLDTQVLSYLERHASGDSSSVDAHEDSLFLQDPQHNEALERLLSHKSLVRYDFSQTSGKKLSYQQTWHYLKSDAATFLFGSGIGGFSSNLAFNFSGVVDNSAMARMFPHYETKAFRENHRRIYESMKYSHVIFHSESNKPFSIYNQLGGEYGIVGLLLFGLGYVLFFIRKISYRSYALPVIVAMLLVSNLNYFFEGLNLYLFIEVLLFLDVKEKNEQFA